MTRAMKTILGICILLLIAPTATLASGFDIAYGTGCWPENPVSAQTFACDTNTGAMTFTVSCILSQPVPDCVGFSAKLEGMAYWGTDLPDWWQLYNTGACRQTSLSVSSDFVSAPQVSCVDPYGGLAIASVTLYETELYPAPYPYPTIAPERFRLTAMTTLTDPVSVDAGVAYYVIRGRINYAKTVGTGACAGCSTPITARLLQVRALSQGSSSVLCYGPINNECLVWQGGSAPCWLVPARNVTWGQVKTLYR